MKKMLAYALAAVLLGAVMMLAPFVSFVSEMDTQAERSYFSPTVTRAMSSETEQAYGIASATYIPDLLFIAIILGFSLVTAFGVMRCFMKKNDFLTISCVCSY